MRPFENERTPWSILFILLGAIGFASLFAFLCAAVESSWIIDQCSQRGKVQTIGKNMTCRVTK
jgi:hypothetical protein